MPYPKTQHRAELLDASAPRAFQNRSSERLTEAPRPLLPASPAVGLSTHGQSHTEPNASTQIQSVLKDAVFNPIISIKHWFHKSFAGWRSGVASASEPHSAEPKCVCPVIASFLTNWNDALPNDADRDRLIKPLISMIIGTQSTKKVELERSRMALDWFLREYTPAWLEAAGMKEFASVLRISPTAQICKASREAAESAWRAKWISEGFTWDASCATREAAQEAARIASAAAGVATKSAAWSAAWSAASVAWANAYDSALAEAEGAAVNAAGVVAWNAVGDARASLQPTVTALQLSAVKLIKKMTEEANEN